MSEPADDDDGLSEYERRFVEAFMGEAMGCGQHAVELVGEARGHSAAVIASRLLQRPQVRAAIKTRQNDDPLVLARVARLRLYSNIARGKELTERIVVGKHGRKTRVQELPTLRERLDALQTLSKICGDFLPQSDDQAEGGKAAGMPLERLIALMTQGGMQ